MAMLVITRGYIYLHNWLILFGQMLVFIFQHQKSHLGDAKNRKVIPKAQTASFPNGICSISWNLTVADDVKSVHCCWVAGCVAAIQPMFIETSMLAQHINSLLTLLRNVHDVLIKFFVKSIC